MRLYNTATRAGSRSCPPPPGPIRMYFCGPTVYQRDPRRQRAAVRRLDVAAALARASSGYDVTLVDNITDINDKIYDGRARARARELAADATAWYVEDTDDLGLGRPDVEPKATETIPEIVALIERADRARPRVPGRRRRLLPRRRAIPSTARSRAARRELSAQSVRGAGAEPALKEDPRDFALWKAHKADEDTWWDSPWGPRPARLAHRVLGDGREAPRACVRDPRRRARPRLSAPRERDRPVARRSGTSSRSSGCTTGCSASPARRCRSRSATSITLRVRARRVGAARRCSCCFLGAHWRKPIDYSDETLAAAARACGRFREVFRSPSEPGGSWDELVAALDDD